MPMKGADNTWYRSLVEGELTHSVPKSSRKAFLSSSDPVVYLEEVNEGSFLGCTGSQVEWNGISELALLWKMTFRSAATYW